MTDYLSDRLKMVYKSIDKDRSCKGRVIDVGSDHGLLALTCLTDGITDFCICTDIHKMPAQRTEKCLNDHCLDGKFQVFCTDGLKGIDLKPDDTVVMAGLGGNTIMSVMTEVMERTDHEVLEQVDFVLQPQKTSDELRVFLGKNGFDIISEDVVIDRDLFYHMMVARFTGYSYDLTPFEKYYGPCLIKSDNDLVKKFHSHLDEIYKFRSRGNQELRKLMEDRHVI